MVPLTPGASSILSLVAQNPEVSDAELEPLLKGLEPQDLRKLVAEAVKIIRQTASQDKPSFPLSAAGQLARSYVKWTHQNAGLRAAF